MKIYLASRFSRRHECHELAQFMKSLGHEITARWVKPDSDHIIPVGKSEQAADAERERFALEDFEDVRAADWTISLTETPRNDSRGGRHVEFGMAVALGHKLTVIGPRETVFHHLPQVEWFESISEFRIHYNIKIPLAGAFGKMCAGENS